MYPVAWFESKEVFLNNKPGPNLKIEREFQPLIILVNEVYKNYKILPEIPGKGCALDYYIQLSLLNLLSEQKSETDIKEYAKYFVEFDRQILHRMAIEIFNF